MAKIVISIFRHDDGRSIYEMIRNSSQRYFSDDFEIIIRENKISHSKYLIKLSSLYKNIRIKYNKNQYGFGRNHNLNFKLIKKDTLWFIVSNPDLVNLPDNLNLIFEDKNIKLISPLILNNKNQKADFMRLDINIFTLFLRFFGRP